MTIDAAPNERHTFVRRLATILCLAIATVGTPAGAANARTSQQRRPAATKRTRARDSAAPSDRRAASGGSTPPAEYARAPAADGTAAPDLSVEVVRRELLLINGTVPVLEITNRERRPISIQRVLINDEWEPTDEYRLRGKRVTLPAKLELGDVLSNNIRHYDKAPVYITLDTDAGLITLKFGR